MYFFLLLLKTAKLGNHVGLEALHTAAVIVLDWNIGACLYGFKLLQNRVLALFVAGTSRLFLTCFGIHYWYLGHCISYICIGSNFYQSTVIRVREGFRRKEQNSSSDGCGSSIKRSSSIDAGHAAYTNEANRSTECTADDLTRIGRSSSQEGINSDKSVESGRRPSLGLRSSSCRSVIQEAEAGTSYDENNNMTITIIHSIHQQFEFGFSVLLLSPVVCSVMAFLRSLQVEEMALTSKSRKYGFVAWLLSTSVGLSLSFLSFSRTTPGFRYYKSSHDSQLFYIGMRILKTRGHRAAYNIFLHESVGGTDYVNSRELSCEMVLDPDPKGYTIVPTCEDLLRSSLRSNVFLFTDYCNFKK
ncbi:Calpain-type cysteine protease DEK1 [Raphanus sativus]|nr:Calpain-type cysteine protease DEK1 [Raphanus sativus]